MAESLIILSVPAMSSINQHMHYTCTINTRYLYDGNASIVCHSFDTSFLLHLIILHFNLLKQWDI